MSVKTVAFKWREGWVFFPENPLGMECDAVILRSDYESLESRCQKAEQALRELVALIPGVRYMDPPDGGDVSVLEQFRRIADEAKRAERLEAVLRELVNCADAAGPSAFPNDPAARWYHAWAAARAVSKE